MGTSVRVAKYMMAPTTEAKRFALRLFPSTSISTHLDGMIPSCPGLPSKNPGTITPAKRSGRIYFEKPQVDDVHSLSSPFLNQAASTYRRKSRNAPVMKYFELKVRPLCVCELSEALDIPLSTLSAHLKILKASGLVVDTKDGRWVVYEISEGKELSGRETFVRKTLNLIEAAVGSDQKFLNDRAVIAKVTRALCSFKMQERRSRLSARKRQAPRIS